MDSGAWRDSARSIRFVMFDGRLAIFLLLFIFHWKYWTFFLSIFAMIAFWFLEYKGYTIPNAYRYLQVLISGKRKLAVHRWRQNDFWH